jgi:hypothetical protein
MEFFDNFKNDPIATGVIFINRAVVVLFIWGFNQ